MFEIDENNLPFVRTRQALLAIDLQNDFVSSHATIPVPNPPNFVDRILDLASDFRTSEKVIWVQTVFETSRPVNDGGNSESVITDTDIPTTQRGGNERPKLRIKKLVEKCAKLVETEGESSEETAAAALDIDEDQISETYLTVEPGELPRAVSRTSPGADFLDSVAQHIDETKDQVFQKTYYSAFKDGSLVQSLRAKFVTDIYLCGALTNISVFATAMDAARHGYAITIVEDCLGYRSKVRHDEALRKLIELTGCEIISSADLIEEIREKRKERERAQKAPKPPSRRIPRLKEKGTKIDDLMERLNLGAEDSSASRKIAAPTGPAKSVAALETRGSSESPALNDPAEELKLPTRTPSTDIKKERVKGKIKTRRRHSKSSAKDSAIVGEASSSLSVEKSSSAATSGTSIATSQASQSAPSLPDKERDAAISRPSFESTTSLEVDNTSVALAKGKGKEQCILATLDLDEEIERMAKLSVKDESMDLCEGDTTIIHDLLEAEVAEGIFERLRDEVRWQKMSHQGGDVPRLVAVQGDIGEDGSIPIYRHPADESPPLLQFTPTVSQIRKRVQERLGHAVNHVLIQFYRDGNDYISEHSDKTLDIVPKTWIANVSLGAQRTMVFRRKKKQQISGDEPGSSQAVQPRQATRAPLPHNSMCRMGLVTNMRWLHGIRQDKRMVSEKSAEELAFDGGRISLTFRKIGTFLSKDQTLIWGQGATSKSNAHAKTVINGDNAESEKMIRAFGKENHASEFDWEEHYGKGFDVVHIENSPKLFLCGEKLADLRIKSMLEDYGVDWIEGKLSPAFHWKDGNSSKEAPPIPEKLPIKLVDNDLSRSVVVGDVAIMLYLDAVYGPKPDVAAKSHADLARTYTRFQQSDELLKKWRNQPFSVKPFRRELELWDAFAAEGPFIAGENISLADYAVWPLLEEIHTEWDTFDGLENLAAYYKRLRHSKTFGKALGVWEEKIESQAAEWPETK